MGARLSEAGFISRALNPQRGVDRRGSGVLKSAYGRIAPIEPVGVANPPTQSAKVLAINELSKREEFDHGRLHILIVGAPGVTGKIEQLGLCPPNCGVVVRQSGLQGFEAIPRQGVKAALGGGVAEVQIVGLHSGLHR
jgi:hypothetical protein